MFEGVGTPLTQKGLDDLSTQLNVPLPKLWLRDVRIYHVR